MRLIKLRTFALFSATIALSAALLIPMAHAASPSASKVTVTKVGTTSGIAVVIGDGMPAAPVTVTVVAGSVMRQAKVTPESDGRFTLDTFLPASYTGKVDVIAQAGTQTITGSSN